MRVPPTRESVAHALSTCLQARIALDKGADGGTICEYGSEVEILSVLIMPRKNVKRVKAKRFEQRFLRFHFRRWHATLEVRAYVVRFWRWRIVHVTSDIEIPVIRRIANILN